jgi:hypothetical protein
LEDAQAEVARAIRDSDYREFAEDIAKGMHLYYQKSSL